MAEPPDGPHCLTSRPPVTRQRNRPPYTNRERGNPMTTATAASDAAAACQRLRGHLAYLKLPAALEALPAILDAARDGTLTALEAIEQLWAPKPKPRRATQARLPATVGACRPRGGSRTTISRPARCRREAHPRPGHAAVHRRGRQYSVYRAAREWARPCCRWHWPGPPARPPGAVHHLRGHDPAAAPRHRRAPVRLRAAVLHHAEAAGPRRAAYRTLDEEARSLLFEVINARYLKGSIITTSHVGIAAWAERLGDPMLAAAALDRLLHRGVIAAIDGPSYHMRAHQQRADIIRKATTAAGRRPVTGAEQRPCPAWGTEFTWTPAAPGQKFCSPRCKHRWHDRYGKARTAVVAAARPHDVAGPPATPSPPPAPAAASPPRPPARTAGSPSRSSPGSSRPPRPTSPRHAATTRRDEST